MRSGRITGLTASSVKYGSQGPGSNKKRAARWTAPPGRSLGDLFTPDFLVLIAVAIAGIKAVFVTAIKGNVVACDHMQR